MLLFTTTISITIAADTDTTTYYKSIITTTVTATTSIYLLLLLPLQLYLSFYDYYYYYHCYYNYHYNYLPLYCTIYLSIRLSTISSALLLFVHGYHPWNYQFPSTNSSVPRGIRILAILNLEKRVQISQTFSTSSKSSKLTLSVVLKRKRNVCHFKDSPLKTLKVLNFDRHHCGKLRFRSNTSKKRIIEGHKIRN